MVKIWINEGEELYPVTVIHETKYYGPGLSSKFFQENWEYDIPKDLLDNLHSKQRAEGKALQKILNYVDSNPECRNAPLFKKRDLEEQTEKERKAKQKIIDARNQKIWNIIKILFYITCLVGLGYIFLEPIL